MDKLLRMIYSASWAVLASPLLALPFSVDFHSRAIMSSSYVRQFPIGRLSSLTGASCWTVVATKGGVQPRLWLYAASKVASTMSSYASLLAISKDGSREARNAAARCAIGKKHYQVQACRAVHCLLNVLIYQMPHSVIVIMSVWACFWLGGRCKAVVSCLYISYKCLGVTYARYGYIHRRFDVVPLRLWCQSHICVTLSWGQSISNVLLHPVRLLIMIQPSVTSRERRFIHSFGVKMGEKVCFLLFWGVSTWLLVWSAF